MSFSMAKFSQVSTLLTFSLVCVAYASSSCRCNGSPSEPIAMEALPNGALKIARLSHSLLPGTPATPHAFAVVMAAMFDAYGFALDQPRLTNATITYADAAQNADRIVMAAGASTIQEFVKSDASKLDKLRQAVSGDFYSIGSPFAKAIMLKFKTAPMPTSPYVPPNLPSKIANNAQCSTVSDPSGWQPLCLKPKGANMCMPQQFRLALLSRAPLMFRNGRAYTPVLAMGIKVPRNSVRLRNLFKGRNKNKEFAQQYRRLLSVSYPLTDRRKTIAEKFAPPAFISLLGLVIDDLALHGADLFQSVRALFIVMGSVRDALVTVATLKQEEAVIRPITVLQCGLVGESRSIWQGPHMGMTKTRVRLSFSRRFRPYLTTPPHASFPSGHTAAATAGALGYMHAVGWRLPKVSNCLVQEAGASSIEGKIMRGEPGFKANITDVPNKGPRTAGFVPARKVTICWHSWRRYAKLTAVSRLYGGIHTPSENSAAGIIGRRAARRMASFVKNL